MENASALTADQAQAADELRTKRLFVGFLSSLLGADQTMTGEDRAPASSTGQYVIANPDGSYSVQGQSVSNRQTAAPVAATFSISPGLLILAGIAFLLLR